MMMVIREHEAKRLWITYLIPLNCLKERDTVDSYPNYPRNEGPACPTPDTPARGLLYFSATRHTLRDGILVIREREPSKRERPSKSETTRREHADLYALRLLANPRATKAGIRRDDLR